MNESDTYDMSYHNFEISYPLLSADNKLPNETITYEIADFVPMKNKQYSDRELHPWDEEGNRHERRKQRKLRKSHK